MAAEEYVRFVVPAWRDESSDVAKGVITVGYELLRMSWVRPEAAAEIRELIDWFERNLRAPRRFNRTTSKGWYRRRTRGISWLKASAVEHVEKLRALAAAVERCGYRVAELRETRVGYVTHEDDVQVVAEPFRDTRTQ